MIMKYVSHEIMIIIAIKMIMKEMIMIFMTTKLIKTIRIIMTIR